MNRAEEFKKHRQEREELLHRIARAGSNHIPNMHTVDMMKLDNQFLEELATVLEAWADRTSFVINGRLLGFYEDHDGDHAGYGHALHFNNDRVIGPDAPDHVPMQFFLAYGVATLDNYEPLQQAIMDEAEKQHPAAFEHAKKVAAEKAPGFSRTTDPETGKTKAAMRLCVEKKGDGTYRVQGLEGINAQELRILLRTVEARDVDHKHLIKDSIRARLRELGEPLARDDEAQPKVSFLSIDANDPQFETKTDEELESFIAIGRETAATSTDLYLSNLVADAGIELVKRKGASAGFASMDEANAAYRQVLKDHATVLDTVAHNTASPEAKESARKLARRVNFEGAYTGALSEITKPQMEAVRDELLRVAPDWGRSAYLLVAATLLRVSIENLKHATIEEVRDLMDPVRDAIEETMSAEEGDA